MGGYDLHGRYYAKTEDALNAEMAQCAEIDARIALSEVNKMKRNLNHESQRLRDYEVEQKIDFLMHKVEELENRIKQLETPQP